MVEKNQVLVIWYFFYDFGWFLIKPDLEHWFKNDSNVYSICNYLICGRRSSNTPRLAATTRRRCITHRRLQTNLHIPYKRFLYTHIAYTIHFLTPFSAMRLLGLNCTWCPKSAQRRDIKIICMGTRNKKYRRFI